MLLAIVAGAFVVGVVANTVRAIFARAYGFLIPATFSFFFWYWIAMGAYRRATRTPEDRRPPT